MTRFTCSLGSSPQPTRINHNRSEAQIELMLDILVTTNRIWMRRGLMILLWILQSYAAEVQSLNDGTSVRFLQYTGSKPAGNNSIEAGGNALQMRCVHIPDESIQMSQDAEPGNAVDADRGSTQTKLEAVAIDPLMIATNHRGSRVFHVHNIESNPRTDASGICRARQCPQR